jgi:hypothetical protein
MIEHSGAGGPSSEPEDLRAAGDRIEQLLDQLGSLPDRRAGQWSEDLVRFVTELYGAGLARVIEMASEPDAPRGAALLNLLAEDDLVASLLLVHDLHPLSLRQRVEQVLADLRASFAEVDVRLVHLDEEQSRLRLRLVASGTSAKGTAAYERRVREAIESGVPELIEVDIDRLLPATPVHFGRRSEVRGAEASTVPEAVEAARAR